MGTITSFLWENRFIILIIAFAILFFVLLGWQRTKVLLYQLMLQAKRMAKDAVLKSGQEQEEWVVKKALQLLPLSLKVFLSEDTIRKIVRWLYLKAKDYADDGQLNGSI
ncbi:MAG: hypothetical protein N2489_08405 [Clostridia bacterium]|nr:hypothetical protein [Clostridia bacterium]